MRVVLGRDHAGFELKKELTTYVHELGHFVNPSTGYERLLYDCMIGDATLFQRADMVEASWSVVQPILETWKATPPKNFPGYAAGTWGPPEAQELIERDGRQWRSYGEVTQKTVAARSGAPQS